MIHHVRFLNLLLACLIFPLSMSYAYNSESYDNGKDRHESIQPLPTLKIESIGDELVKCYITPEVVLDAMPPAPAVGMRFSLNELDDALTTIESSFMAAAMMEDPVDPAFIPYLRILGKGNYSAKAKKIKKIVDGALQSAKVIDQLTGGDLVTMPLVKNQMIGQTQVSIIFNKARIYPQFTLLEVFVKVKMAQVDIEGKPVELFFAADDILFSQEEGIIGGTIGLVNDYAIKVGNSEKAAIWLKGMTKTKKTTLPNGATVPANTDPENPFDDKYYDKGGTYVSFDCDGFKEMGIAGEVLFSREWVIPADAEGFPLAGTTAQPTPRVRASFGAVVQNMDDLFVTIDMPHFLVSKYQDISLNIGGAYLDLSSYRNPPGIPESYGIEPDLWEGVYIQNIGITLPEPFKRTCGSFATPPDNPQAKPKTCRIKIEAKHLLIDQFGVDGFFSISGQAPLIGGPIMDGEWGWSLNTLSIQLQNSELTGFGFAGGLGVPILDKDDPLEYTATINLLDKSYVFTVETAENSKKSFPIWNAASVNLDGPIEVTVIVKDGEFDASVNLSSGSLTIGNPKDKKEGDGGSILKMPSITFNNLKFSTKSPKFTIGYFGLSDPDNQASVVNFPVVPTNLGLSTPINSDKVNLDFGVILNLMKTEQSTISATGAFSMKGAIERDLGGAQRWVFKDLIFNGAQVIVDLPQFYGKGSLQIFKNDKVYGKGFSANLTAKILGDNLDQPTSKGKFNLNMAAIFGSSPSSTGDLGVSDGGTDEELDNYRYWMVDGMIQSTSLRVPLMPPFEMNGLGGGAFYHMRPFSYIDNATQDSEAITQIGQATTGIVYRPNANTGLGVKFTTAITTKADLISGLLTCIIRFSPDGVLQNVTFWGTVDILKEGGASNRAKPDITTRLDTNTKETEEIKAEDEQNVKMLKDIDYVAGNESMSDPGFGIQGQLGISLDFDGGFTLHGYAKATIQAKAISGVGTLDLLLDLSDDEGAGSSSSGNGDWHLYIGGYYKNEVQQVLVPGFLNESELVLLEPIVLSVEMGNTNVTAQAYFLTGTNIPGPPPPPAEVVAFFGSDDPDVIKDNRDRMSCGGKGPAMGTGIAFGATAGFEIDKKVGGLFGKCPFGIKVKAVARVGFDLALLKYDANTVCSLSGDTPHGLRGYRATGRAYAIVELQDGHITCFPLPNIGVGVKIEFDVFKPSYLDINLTVKAFGEKVNLGFDIGDQCGIICE